MEGLDFPFCVNGSCTRFKQTGASLLSDLLGEAWFCCSIANSWTNFSPFFPQSFFKRDMVDLHEKVSPLSSTHLLLLISSSIPKSGHEPYPRQIDVLTHISPFWRTYSSNDTDG